MCIFSLKNHKLRLALAAVLSCSGAVAQAQLSSFPEFIEKHFRTEATDAQDGPKLRTQLEYSADDTLITRNSAKFNNDGFEDHMALGIVQNFGAARARVTYNLQRYDYSSWKNQSEDVTIDFHYRSLHVQRRFEHTAQVSTIGLPIDLSVAHLDVSYSQTLQVDAIEPIDVYQFVSRVNGLTFSAAWQDNGGETWADYSTEYRPANCCVMKYTYTDHGAEFARGFRSEFTARDYRLAGEYLLQTDAGNQTHVAGALDIEKETKLAALKLRLEYSDYVDSPAFFFQVESHVDF